MQNVVVGRHPAEVEDLLLDSGSAGPRSCSVACVAEYAVLTCGLSGPALVFQVASEGARRSIVLGVPRTGRSANVGRSGRLFLAAWAVEWEEGRDGRSSARMGIAICSPDGVLRIYRDIHVASIRRKGRRKPPRCEEVRVVDALLSSAGEVDEMVCHGIEYIPGEGGKEDALVVFGSCQSGARVILGSRDSGMSEVVVESLRKDHYEWERRLSRRPMNLGSILFSAIRSIGGGGQRNDEAWIRGAGRYSLVGSGFGSDSSCYAIYRGGDIVKWSSDAFQWSWNITDSVRGGHNGGHWLTLQAAVTSNGTIALLAAHKGTESLESQQLFLIGVREGVDGAIPEDVIVQIDLDLTVQNVDSVQFAMSGDIAYIACPEEECIIWSSITPGVSSEDQVKGRVEIADETDFILGADVAFGLADSVASGGAVAFLAVDSVLLVKGGVPAPVMSGAVTGTADARGKSDADGLVWRAYLQYSAGQSGAAKATLSALVTEAASSNSKERKPAVDAIGKAMSNASRRIIDSSVEDVDTPVLLLIDARLKEKASQHGFLLKLLADGGLLVDVVPLGDQAPFMCLWEVLEESVKAAIVSDAEKLAAARGVRAVENFYSDVRRSSRFLDDAVSTAGSPRSSHISEPDAVDEEEEEKPSVIASALGLAADEIKVQGLAGKLPEGPIALYEKVSLFDRFLPTLGLYFKECVDELKLKSSRVYNESEGSCATLSSLRRFARRSVLMVNEAALAVVQNAAEVRDQLKSLLNVEDTGDLESRRGGWSCAKASCRDVLADIIDLTLQIARSCRRKEATALRNAAVQLSDALLLCGRTALSDSAPLVESQRLATSPRKRRRVLQAEEEFPWERERLEVLERLSTNGLLEECLKLAIKHEDFGVMLQLKYCSPDFDDFLESSISQFGNKFGKFVFKWLEDRGEVKLLLQGRLDDTGVETRSENTRSVLGDYFLQDRKEFTNLSWMHFLAQGEGQGASQILCRQARAISRPGKPNALTNCKLLYSIAKLALLADGAIANEEKLDVIDNNLFFLRANEELSAADQALLERDVLVKKMIDESPIESGTLAGKAISALQALQSPQSSKSHESELLYYIWRRTVERQGHIWLPLTFSAHSMTDTKLRGKLRSTAFFQVAQATSLTADALQNMIKRGTFQIDELQRAGRLREFYSLLQTATVLGANEEPTASLRVQE